LIKEEVLLNFLNFAQWLFLEENSRQLNRFQSRDERVQFGKSKEAQILNAMSAQHGWVIQEVSSGRDMHQKIDGMLVSATDMPISLPAPIQVKYRDTGNDILMEVTWAFKDNYSSSIEDLLTGRDMKGIAKLYVSLDLSGTLIRVRLADEAKSIAKKLLEGLIQSRKKVFNLGRHQIRVVRDPDDGRQKINAFLDPNDFNWKKDYSIQDIWSAPSSPKTLQSPAQAVPKDIPPSAIPAIAQALEKGSATFRLPNNAKKVKTIEKFVNKRGLSLTIQGDQIILSKVA
jgi:hypothetical protein